MIVGNDVSEWQGNIDWNTYKNNTNFVIIRSSYGVGYKDKKFDIYQSEARRVGLPIGYYHYSYPQYNTPEAEADYFLSVVNIKDGEMLCLDYEESWNGDRVGWCKRFLDRIASKLNGYKALIYLNQSLATNNDWSPLVNAGYGLWIAAYTYDPKKNDFKIGAWKFAAMQQWTNQQKVPGIPTVADGNVFFGDISAFKKYCYSLPQPQQPSTDYQKLFNDLKIEFDNYKKTYIYKQSDLDNKANQSYLNGKLDMKNQIINLIKAV